MKTMRTKIIFACTLILLLGGIVAAFWVSGVFVNNDEEDVNINVGKANEINTIITINDKEDEHPKLVPIATIYNSEDGAEEFLFIPLELVWLEEDNTSWGEGLRGIFVISPTVTLVPSDPSLTSLLYAAEALIHVYFFPNDIVAVSELAQSLGKLVGDNPNRTLADFEDAINKVDDQATEGEFKVELELGNEEPTIVWMLVVIDTPCAETFPYIHGGTIYVNAKIEHESNYVENILPTPIINIADLISSDPFNKLDVGSDGKLFALPYLSVEHFIGHIFDVENWFGEFHAIVVEISAATSIVSMWGFVERRAIPNDYSGKDYVIVSPEYFPLLERFIGQVDQWALGIDGYTWQDIRQMPIRITAEKGVEMVVPPIAPVGTRFSYQFVLILSDSDTDGHIDIED